MMTSSSRLIGALLSLLTSPLLPWKHLTRYRSERLVSDPPGYLLGYLTSSENLMHTPVLSAPKRHHAPYARRFSVACSDFGISPHFIFSSCRSHNQIALTCCASWTINVSVDAFRLLPGCGASTKQVVSPVDRGKVWKDELHEIGCAFRYLKGLDPPSNESFPIQRRHSILRSYSAYLQLQALLLLFCHLSDTTKLCCLVLCKSRASVSDKM